MSERSPIALAALACGAVRGLEPVCTRPHPCPDWDIDAAVVEDDLSRSWIVRAPRSPVAAARLDRETQLLAGLLGWLPFSVPEVSGSVRLPSGGYAVVHRMLTGNPLEPSELAPGPGLAAALGRALAAVHELPERLVEDAGLPVYTAEEHRRRKLAELDRAAGTGFIPAGLLTRWEKAFEEAGAWRFVPCVVHGDLAAENVLIDDCEVLGILDWGEARIGDPADDLAWIAAGADPDCLESVLEAYALGRRQPPDRDLARRARLAGELALARWLLHGVALDDPEVVQDARSMLNELDAALMGEAW